MLDPMTSPPPCPPTLLEEAVALARQAGELTLQWFDRPGLVVEAKGDGSPVTEADRAAERFLRAELARRHPGDGVLGEEEAETAGTSGRRWIVDPIDGTRAFTRGVPLFTNLLAAEDAHGPVLGIINLPAMGRTVWAGRGLGCWNNGVPARVSSRPTLPDSYLTTSAYDHWPEDALLAVRRSGLRMRTWGDGFGYAMVATGQAEAMVDPVAEPYDLAPVPVIIAEAGGRFSDWAGDPRYDRGSGLATNGLLHDEILGLLTGGTSDPGAGGA
jgi:histidinol phosphatase-like enzyme (inositol monophosphatase family)